MNCQRATELLPFLINRTLSPEEEAAVRAHVDACAECPRELERTRRMAWIVERHPSADTLADYASGLETTGLPRVELEQHLATCPDCAQDIGFTPRSGEDAESATDSDVAHGRVLFLPSRPPTRLVAAAAAVIAAAFLGGIATQSLLDEASEASEVQLAELLPGSLVDRADPSGGAPLELAADEPLTLLLILELGQRPDDLRLQVLGPDGGVVTQVTDLEARDAATVAVHVPAGAWPEGDLQLRLEGRSDGGWQFVAEYAVRLGLP